MGSSTIELSLEETNRLRIKLGLRPLALEQKTEDFEGEEGAIQEEDDDDHKSPVQIEQGEVLENEAIPADDPAIEEDEEDDEDELLDPSAWVERMRRREKEQQMSKKRKREKERKEKAEVPEMTFRHKVDLKNGESITLTMSDQRLLDERGELREDINHSVTMEDVRSAELQQYNRNVKERKKIKELQASIGPSGISSRTFDDNDDDVDEAEDRDKGMRLESDETNLSLKPSITVDPPTKPKFKARQPVKHKAINWDEILGTTANQEQEASTTRAEEDLFRAPTQWSTIGQDDLADDLEANLLSQAIQQAALKPVGVKAEAEAVSSIALIDNVKEEKPTSLVGDVDMKPDITLGTIDADLGKTASSMTSTSEFAKSLLTPLDRIEERRSALNEKRLRGLNVNVSSSGANREDFDITKVSDIHLEQVLDPEGLDGGLVSALDFLKRKGDINADRWNLGRVGRDKRIPLHKGTGEDDIKIDYVDKWGNVQNPKDAFRDMSYHFHGKGPGRKKQEKKLKKMELVVDTTRRLTEHRVKTGLPEEVLPTMRALQIQNAKGEAGLILSSTDNRL